MPHPICYAASLKTRFWYYIILLGLIILRCLYNTVYTTAFIITLICTFSATESYCEL